MFVSFQSLHLLVVSTLAIGVGGAGVSRRPESSTAAHYHRELYAPPDEPDTLLFQPPTTIPTFLGEEGPWYLFIAADAAAGGLLIADVGQVA